MAHHRDHPQRSAHARGASSRARPTPASAPASPAARRHELYLNRELSWLEFNQRVLEEARLSEHPLLERVKFLAIAASNLDEFVMIRVSGLQHQIADGPGDELSDDGLTPQEQLALLRARIQRMQAEIDTLWTTELSRLVATERVALIPYRDLDERQTAEMRRYFEAEIFPVLTPLAIDPGHPFPHISNLSMNLAIVLSDPVQGRRLARMKLPATLPRLVPCPPSERRGGSGRDKEKRNGHGADAQPGAGDGQCFVWLEQLVAANLDTLFTGLEVVESHAFRITRNAEFEIQEDEASDLLRTIEEGLRQRHFGPVARLEINQAMPADLRDLLAKNLLVAPPDVVAVNGPLGVSDLMELTKIERPDLKDPPLVTRVPRDLQIAVDERRPDELFAAVAARDILLHHPYDSFRPVIALIEAAAGDSQVQAIKQTLYRVGSRSPIVRALAQARDDDTQVAVLVELKARFDEENNIEWARALEDAGVHVVYGLLGLKTHCKMALVVRREGSRLKRYLHLGTGNYNPATARVYTDFSLLTASDELAADVSDLFNLLTGYSRQTRYRKLLVAPVNMRERLTALIAHEAECARRGLPARLLFKMNALVDPDMIDALYAASQAGVRVDLIVRGICCLRPGVAGLSESVRVVSIVGRFLEHSRAYYFGNGAGAPGEEAGLMADSTDDAPPGDAATQGSGRRRAPGGPALYLGSADLMPRNLDRRIEVLFPIEESSLRACVLDDVLEVNLRDTAKAWELRPDGSWSRVAPPAGDTAFSSQEHLLDTRRAQADADPATLAAAEVKFTPATIYPPLPA